MIKDNPFGLEVSEDSLVMALRKGSAVWDCFERVDDRAYAECKLLKFNGPTATPMREHLSRKHPCESFAAAVVAGKTSSPRSTELVQQFVGGHTVCKKKDTGRS